jgi:hypothetical protein
MAVVLHTVEAQQVKNLYPSGQKVFVRVDKASLSGLTKGLCPS